LEGLSFLRGSSSGWPGKHKGGCLIDLPCPLSPPAPPPSTAGLVVGALLKGSYKTRNQNGERNKMEEAVTR